MAIYMRKGAFSHLLFTVLILSGCVSAAVVRYPTANYNPTVPNSVLVFSDFPPQPFQVIGETEASGAPAATWGSVANGMKIKAAEIGGDAVVLIVQDTPFAGTWNTPGQVKGSSYGSSMSTGSFSAYRLGNNAYGSWSGHGSSYTNTNYSITPPASTPMYGKYAKGFVIKFVQAIAQHPLMNRAKPRFVKDMRFPPVAVSRFDASAFAISTFAWYHSPAGQVMSLPLNPLDQQDIDLIAGEIKKAISQELTQNGYTLQGETSLFEDDETTHARFLFGGIAKEMKVHVYGYPFPDHEQLEAVVEWQVFDKRTKKVIHKGLYTGRGAIDLRVGVRHSAVADSFKFLLGDGRLIESMKNAVELTP